MIRASYVFLPFLFPNSDASVREVQTRATYYIDDTILNNSHPLTPVSSLKLFDTIVVNKQLHIIFYNFEVIVNIPT